MWDSGLQDENLWATLAGMATYAKNLQTAEIAYSAIDEVRPSQLGRGGEAGGRRLWVRRRRWSCCRR